MRRTTVAGLDVLVHSQLSYLFCGLPIWCTKIAKRYPSSHEPSHVAERIDKEDIEVKLGVVVVTNERCSWILFPLMSGGVQLSDVQTRWIMIVIVNWMLERGFQIVPLRKLNPAWKASKNSSLKGLCWPTVHSTIDLAHPSPRCRRRWEPQCLELHVCDEDLSRA